MDTCETLIRCTQQAQSPVPKSKMGLRKNGRIYDRSHNNNKKQKLSKSWISLLGFP